MSYKAALTVGAGQLEIREQELPAEIPSGHFVADVQYCSICGSDRQFWASNMLDGFLGNGPLGHEFTAIVSDPGDTSLAVGDRICIYPAVTCGDCEPCKNGAENICALALTHYAGLTTPGGFAQKYIGLEADAVKLPDNVDFQQGALVEPLSVAYHAVRRSGIKPGDKVLIIGAGIIGLYCSDMARLAGASTVVISEYSDNRLKAAQELADADAYYSAKDPELGAKLKEAYGSPLGDGFDIVFECSASDAGYATAMAASKKQGLIMCIGSSNRPTGIILNDFIAGEFTIKGCYAYTRAEFNQCLDLIASGKYDPMRYVTKVASLDNIQETFDKLFKDPDNADVKVQIKMN